MGHGDTGVGRGQNVQPLSTTYVWAWNLAGFRMLLLVLLLIWVVGRKRAPVADAPESDFLFYVFLKAHCFPASCLCIVRREGAGGLPSGVDDAPCGVKRGRAVDDLERAPSV